MYKKLRIKDLVRVTPDKITDKLEESIKQALQRKYEGRIFQNTGIILAIDEIDSVEEGVIYPTDAGVHYPVMFDMVTYEPELHEVVEGDVIEVAEFGAFVRVGPMDGLVHVSQIMDDYVSFDDKNATFAGRKSHKTLNQGDHVRARIISISYEKESKIGLTMRQPGLGSTEWVEQEKRAVASAPKEESSEKEE